jgi:hypothetical protein
MKGLPEGDVSAALSRLNFGIEDLNRQLKSEITKHHSSLLLQCATVNTLSSDLQEVKKGLIKIEQNVLKLNKKVELPFKKLEIDLLLLTRLTTCNDLMKKCLKFLNLVKKLKSQMVEIETTTTQQPERQETRKERVMAEAALILAELETLLNDTERREGQEEVDSLSITSLNVVQTELNWVSNCREKILDFMQTSIQQGLTRLDQPLLASSLQTSYNLSVLPSLVDSLVKDLNDLVYRKVQLCFDLQSLSREVNQKEIDGGGTTTTTTISSSGSNSSSSFVYKSRTRNEPSSSNLPLWTSTMWNRLENLINDLGNICIKVYTLEKVLKLKKTTTTDHQSSNGSFLDIAMTVLDNKPSVLFWTCLSRAFELQGKESIKSSNFISNLFSSGYPRLVRLFQEFFSKIAVHTDTVYTLTSQSPETVLVLRSIQPFETVYLTRSTNRLNDSISKSFNQLNSSMITSSFITSSLSRLPGGPPSIPTAQEGLNFSRLILNELDAVKFDAILSKNLVEKVVKTNLEQFLQRCMDLVQFDHNTNSTSLLGPLQTNSQQINSDLTSCLYHLWFPLDRAYNNNNNNNTEREEEGEGEGEGNQETVVHQILKPLIVKIKTSYLSIVNPLIMSIRREFSNILAKMHDQDNNSNSNSNSNDGGGDYIFLLTSKLNLIKSEILGPNQFKVGQQLLRDWALDLSRFIVQTFLLHASILQGGQRGGGGGALSESQSMKLVKDTTNLEFLMNSYLSSFQIPLQEMGDQFKALRAFRPLLFLPTQELVQHSQSSVPTLIVLHHLISRSNGKILLPNQFYNWNQKEYVRWLNEHTEQDRLGMIRKVIVEQGSSRKETDNEEDDDEVEKWRDWVMKILDRND